MTTPSSPKVVRTKLAKLSDELTEKRNDIARLDSKLESIDGKEQLSARDLLARENLQRAKAKLEGEAQTLAQALDEGEEELAAATRHAAAENLRELHGELQSMHGDIIERAAKAEKELGEALEEYRRRRKEWAARHQNIHGHAPSPQHLSAFDGRPGSTVLEFIANELKLSRDQQFLQAASRSRARHETERSSA